MLSCQYEQKSLRIYSSPLLNQCHEELGRSEDKRLHMYDFSAVVNLFAHLVQHCIFKLCHDKKKKHVSNCFNKCIFISCLLLLILFVRCKVGFCIGGMFQMR